MTYIKRVLFVGFLATTFACQESRDQQSSINSYRRDIGQAIPTDVAYRWVRQAGVTEARTDTHTLPAVQLRSMLPTTRDISGVIIHHSIDATGIYHVLVAPLRTDGDLWSSNKVWDATGKQWLTNTEAQSWANRYSEANPATPWYHFFGSNLFDAILADAALDVLEIVPAVNDDKEPQLLLFAWSAGTSAQGRGASLTVYDMSNPCPPCAGSSSK